jgi:hypothetical protein
VIVPKYQVVTAGQTLNLKALLAGAETGGCRWALLEGPFGATLTEAGGEFRAPLLAQPGLFRVRAALADRPEVQADALITVLPRQPFDLVGQVLDGWLDEVYSRELPFLDLATGRSFRPDLQGAENAYPDTPDQLLPCLVAGYGLPAMVRWPPRPQAEAQLLSYRNGDHWVRLDVSGRKEQELCLRENVVRITVEALDRPGAPGTANLWYRRGGDAPWCRHFTVIPVGVRGMLLLAGNPLAGAGMLDGGGLEARFREPWGLAWVGDDPRTGGLIAADCAAHCLRSVGADGLTVTLWGRPGEAGHRDGTGPEARFNRPTWLASRAWPFRSGRTGKNPWEVVVADSGNHVLRQVTDDWRVTTLAGVPGQAGCLDHPDPAQALFNDPQGVAIDSAGNVYVADRGNALIRVVRPGGPVETLAGVPGSRGSEDGPRGTARFRDLKGLALINGLDGLLVADGHCIRKVALDGEVTTLLGSQGTAGFLAEWEPDWAPGQPCLDDPAGLLVLGNDVYICDRGNHAVRHYHLRTRALRTLAGDPGHPAIRPGLLRDGIPGPLGPDYAAVQAPRALAARFRSSVMVSPCSSVVVSTGRCLAQIQVQGLPAWESGPPVEVAVEPAALQVELSCTARILVPVDDQPDDDAQPNPRTLYWTADFLNEDGTAAELQQRGTALQGQELSASDSFDQAGAGTVLFRWVTDQGCSGSAQAVVQVAP